MTDAPRLSVGLSFDFDATSVWIVDTDNPAAISRGEFCAVAVPRILRMLSRHDIRSTFFVPGHTALAYPEVVRQIVDHGHEIGHHGWVHENPADFDEAGERRILDLGLKALKQVAGITPVGYRSPAAALSTRTIGLLQEYGFAYDSSCAGSDFTPYYQRVGDRFGTDEPFRFGESIDLVAMPFSWILDDFPHMEFEPGWSTEQSPPSVVREIWQGEFDYAYDEAPGGVFGLCSHPQVIGRGSRLRMLEQLIEHMQQPGVVFEPLAESAARWRADNPLDAWLATDPVHARRPAVEIDWDPAS
jgi:peptidoglycan-N-acetylglucosamine deacetylase